MVYEQLGVANRDLVSEGVERLRPVFESFIHEKQNAGRDFHFVDGLMIAHNFYKLILYHIADEMVDESKERPDDKEKRREIKRDVRNLLMQIAISTLQKALGGSANQRDRPDPDLSALGWSPVD
jgi:hypothetical protein